MELSADNAAEWLTRHGVETAGGAFSELGGGVSNRVVRVDAPCFQAVLKQSLGRLRVEHEWLSDRGRIFREAAAMRWLEAKTRGGRVPRLLLEDPSDFTIAMESAPPGAPMWKTKLFEGDLTSEPAIATGTLLGSMIAASWDNPEACRIFGDQTVFDQLRIDPYYRFTARVHPSAAPWIHRLMQSSAARRVSLVHGDWSPKNLLCSAEGLWAIDWEVIHFGDPSFDAAFLLNHLLLKTIAMPARRGGLTDLALAFTQALRAELPPAAAWVPEAALEHLPALLLARVDGKSPAEYLDAPMRQAARTLAFDLMAHPAATVQEAFTR